MHDQDKVNEIIESGTFEQVGLFTAEGTLVTRVIIPKFRPKMKVLVWGFRVFVNLDPGYREAPFYPVVPIHGVTDNGLPELTPGPHEEDSHG
jgi:hypothetical protein